MADTPDLNDLIDLILIESLMQSEDESSDAWLYHILQHFVHITFQFTFLLTFMTKRRKKARVKDYVDNVLPLYTLDDLRQHFRITRSTFDQIVILLFPKSIVGNKGGIMKVPVEKQLLIFIRYASSQQTLTEITDTFSVCEATIHTIVHRTLSIICSEMLPDLIK